ncbi:MAG: DUF3592 domain-containing protein [Streptosporangiaceae bacterium]
MEIGLYVLPGLFVLAGSYFVAAGLLTVIRAARFAERAETVPGRVTGVRPVIRDRGLPTLAFNTMAGKKITTECPVETGHGVGDEVEVLYDPGDPADARVAGVRSGGMVLVVSGAIILLGALLVLSALLILHLLVGAWDTAS